MAPSRRNVPDDSSSGSKVPIVSTKSIGKKPANSALGHGTVNVQKEQNKSNGVIGDKDGSDASKGLSWDKEKITVLQQYRFQHRLLQPSPYANTFNRAVLETTGIGQLSPTAIAKRRAAQNQTSKQNLATAVRKHFNSMPADQTAVAAGMIYTVNNQGTEFKKRTAPVNSKSGQT